VEIKENRLFIPKFKKNGIRVKLHRQIPAGSIIKQATLSRHNAKYFISVLIDDQQELRNKVQPVNSVGIDMGLSQLYIFSNGEKIDNPKWLRASERRLTKAQRILSRKKLGSQNRDKAKLRLQKLHTKISNQRRDYIHKMTDAITKQFDIICIETLAIKNMIQNLHLSKSIQDASWNEFARQLAYKAQWKGKYFVQINRYYPSSKTCSVCGHYRKDMPLQIRSWTCSECHTKHDRDVNAAINIERQGLSSLPVEVTRLLAPMKQEAAAVLAYPT
jgi:putative transposase